MTSSPKGFGNSPPPARKKAPSPGAAKRQQAAKQLEDYQAKGLPQFTVYVRLPEKPDSWIPVGEIAVKRSNLISQAIFANEAELLKGALRLYPKLSKVKERLEYGYKLKDELYADEPIQLAIRPVPTFLDKLFAPLRQWLQKQQKKQPKKSS